MMKRKKEAQDELSVVSNPMNKKNRLTTSTNPEYQQPYAIELNVGSSSQLNSSGKNKGGEDSQRQSRAILQNETTIKNICGTSKSYDIQKSITPTSDDSENSEEEDVIYNQQEFDCNSLEGSSPGASEDEYDQDIVEAVSSNEARVCDAALCSRKIIGSTMQSDISSKKYAYIDEGDPDYKCEHCGAIFWYGERLNKRKHSNKPKFSRCCMEGQVVLPFLTKSPDLLWRLIKNNDEISKHFRDNIRAYNMIFSFTSIGGRVDHCLKQGRGPKMFTLHGENYHLMGSLQPKPGDYPKFLQLYIIDTENEVDNRLNILSKAKGSAENNKKKMLEKEIIENIIKLLNDINPHVKAFRFARDRFNMNDEETFHMRIISNRTTDGRIYNLPTTSEVAALIPGDFGENMDKRDIVLQKTSGKLKRISELHVAYLSLQYPLLFPRGEDGFRLGIEKTKKKARVLKKQMDITMRQFFAFRLQERKHEEHILLRSKRLLQQFIVDAYTMIESDRLRYIKKNHNHLRSSSLQVLHNASDAGNTNLDNQGKRVIIPASFTGGPRYMEQNYLDAMAICKHFGFPDLFITFTCNPKWPEIVRFCKERHLNYDDRPDIICRIFKMKLDNLMHDLTVDHILGKTVSAMYTIEFQKRGLPHAHILLFMDSSSKFLTADEIDKIISAEIPDKVHKPELYEVVKDCMIHGPCGAVNPKSPCMVEGKCSKFFPKRFNSITRIDKEGFPVYRRRDSGIYVEKNGFKCDNQYVIPYNEKLSGRYRAHINVEWCNQAGSIKYLFKYIHKGYDRVTFAVEPSANVVDAGSNPANQQETSKKNKDEVKDWFDCRYVSTCEAMWRILQFPIHHRTTPVVKLTFHEEGKQPIYYKEGETTESVIDRLSNDSTQFLSWFDLNKKVQHNPQLVYGKKQKVFPDSTKLLYEEIPNYFTWNGKEKRFSPRERGFAIGRINFVPRAIEDAYYLRILLNIKRGATGYTDLKTVNGVLHDSFRDAVFALGLLDDDKEYINGIKEASFWCSATYVRRLFGTMLLSESITKPEFVWEKCWKILSEDIERRKRAEWKCPGLNLSDDEKKKYALQEIDRFLTKNGSSLSKFQTMPQVLFDDSEKCNHLLVDERNYNRYELKTKHDEWLSMLTVEQKKVYDEIMDAVLHEKGGVFFVSGFGGTGKTFLWKILSAAIRSNGNIVLNVASSGIASLLLEGGRTAHSRFGIPINPNEWSTCSMARGSDLAELVNEAKLIIWDEAPMMSKYCFETLDRSLQDVIRSPVNKRFGGKVVVFGGDFRQILPVRTGAGREEIVFAALNSSDLWKDCKVLKLTKNMRLFSNISEDEKKEIEDFSKWILDVGDGKVSHPNDGIALIDIPEEFLIPVNNDPIQSIVNEVYGSAFMDENDPTFYQGRAILCPTNEDVNSINDHMSAMLKGEERIYLSSDSIDPSDKSSLDNPIFSSDFLNSIKLSGVPNHCLRLKIGCPVMLLRNIDPSNGLCNGTRLQITNLADTVVQCKVITGTRVGDIVVIHRILITPSDTRLPFKFRRRQFPLTVAFAMTINKSQGQTLGCVGIYLPRPVFSHGQLYVAISRVKSKSGLKILITDKNGNPQKQTTNVVFKEVFQNLK